MGLLSKLLGAIDVMRAEVFMEYQPRTPRHILPHGGRAAVEWVYLNHGDPRLRPYLIALLYARTLINQPETRTKLFELVDVVSKQNVREEGQPGFLFPEWMLRIGFRMPDQRIWPWQLVDNPTILFKPKVYKATLQAFPKSKAKGFGIHLKMASGQARLLSPASVLVAITSYTESIDSEGRYELALLLWQVNEFYGSPDSVRMWSESKALAAATTAFRSGYFRGEP